MAIAKEPLTAHLCFASRPRHRAAREIPSAAAALRPRHELDEAAAERLRVSADQDGSVAGGVLDLEAAKVRTTRVRPFEVQTE